MHFLKSILLVLVSNRFKAKLCWEESKERICQCIMQLCRSRLQQAAVNSFSSHIQKVISLNSLKPTELKKLHTFLESSDSLLLKAKKHTSTSLQLFSVLKRGKWTPPGKRASYLECRIADADLSELLFVRILEDVFNINQESLKCSHSSGIVILAHQMPWF